MNENMKIALSVIVAVLVSISASYVLITPREGPMGSQGIQGELGLRGEPGESIVGPVGLQGESGLQGIQGVQGIQGEQGEVGPPSFGNLTRIIIVQDLGEKIEYGYVVNGDFEEPTWNVVGWETYGHLGAGSGEDSLEGRQLGLCGDSGATAEQTIFLYEYNLYFEFYYSAVPNGDPIEFIVYFDDIVVFDDVFDGAILPWSSVVVDLSPLMSTLGEHTIKFVVPQNNVEGSRVMIDKVSISQTAYSTGSYIEVEGIVNGDFSDGTEGWFYQGKSGGYAAGAICFYQRYGGTFITQEISISENQGIAFDLKSNGARLEIQIDGSVIFYGDYRDGTDWIRLVVPFGNVYLGPRDIYFIVLSGEDDGSYIALDNITLVEFP